MKTAHSNTVRIHVSGAKAYSGCKSKKMDPWAQSIIDNMPEEHFNKALLQMNSKQRKILLRARNKGK